MLSWVYLGYLMETLEANSRFAHHWACVGQHDSRQKYQWTGDNGLPSAWIARYTQLTATKSNCFACSSLMENAHTGDSNQAPQRGVIGACLLGWWWSNDGDSLLGNISCLISIPLIYLIYKINLKYGWNWQYNLI